jgi:hypothetical protein
MNNYYKDEKGTTALSIYKNNNTEAVISKPLSYLQYYNKNNSFLNGFNDFVSKHKLIIPSVKNFSLPESNIVENNSFNENEKSGKEEEDDNRKKK